MLFNRAGKRGRRFEKIDEMISITHHPFTVRHIWHSHKAYPNLDKPEPKKFKQVEQKK